MGQKWGRGTRFKKCFILHFFPIIIDLGIMRQGLQNQVYVSLLLCCCLTAQSCLTLCDPKDCSPPGPSVHGIFQARTLERVAIPFSRGSSQPRDQTWVSCTDRLTAGPPGKPFTWDLLSMRLSYFLQKNQKKIKRKGALSSLHLPTVTPLSPVPWVPAACLLSTCCSFQLW